MEFLHNNLIRKPLAVNFHRFCGDNLPALDLHHLREFFFLPVCAFRFRRENAFPGTLHFLPPDFFIQAGLQLFLYMWFYIDKLVIVQKCQFPVNHLPQAVILPFLHTFPIHKLAEGKVDQVNIYLDFKAAVFRSAVSNPDFFQVGKIHAVLIVFLKAEILDQPFCFFQFRAVRCLCFRFFSVNGVFFRLRRCMCFFRLPFGIHPCLCHIFREISVF